MFAEVRNYLIGLVEREEQLVLLVESKFYAAVEAEEQRLGIGAWCWACCSKSTL